MCQTLRHRILETSKLSIHLLLFEFHNFNIQKEQLLTSRLVSVLNKLHYNIDEYLISPMILGIPNDRRRYYLAAKLVDPEIHTEYPLDDQSVIQQELGQEKVPIKPLTDYIQTLDEIDPYLVKEKDIRKRTGFKFDVVQPSSTSCSVFTKAYGTHHFFGTGSFLQTLNCDVFGIN